MRLFAPTVIDEHGPFALKLQPLAVATAMGIAATAAVRGAGALLRAPADLPDALCTIHIAARDPLLARSQGLESLTQHRAAARELLFSTHG